MSHIRAVVVVVLGSVAMAGLSHAGGQGPGLERDFYRSDQDLLNWLANPPPDVPPARFVCIDAPATECFDLDRQGVALISPDCPGGPAARACRPAVVADTQLEGRLALSYSSAPLEDVGDQYDPSICADQFGPNIANLIPNDYREVSRPDTQDSPYSNNAFALLQTIPDLFDCATLIQTDSADRLVVGSAAVQFELVEFNPFDSDVYVAYWAGATQLPAWLTSGFTATTDVVTTTGSVSYRIWKSNQSYPPGATVTLGGNAPPGVSPLYMYFAFVRFPVALRACQTYRATVSVIKPSGGPAVVEQIEETGCYDFEPYGNRTLTLPIAPFDVGWLLGPRDCDRLGEVGLEIERQFGVNGAIDRAALREVGREVFPAALCQPDASGACTIDPAVTFVEPDGSLSVPQRVGSNPYLCRFPIRFATPTQTRALLKGPGLADIDTSPLWSTSGIASDARGIVTDLDLKLKTTTPYADELDVIFSPYIGLSIYRPGGSCCSHSGVALDLHLDDEAPTARSGCTPTSGRVRPDAPLTLRDGGRVGGNYDLSFVDRVDAGDGTDLTSWKVLARTRFTACNDGLDNDGDGTIDWDGAGAGLSDPGCIGFDLEDEEVPPIHQYEADALQDGGWTYVDQTPPLAQPAVSNGRLRADSSASGFRSWRRSDRPLGSFLAMGGVLDARLKIESVGFNESASDRQSGFTLSAADEVGRIVVLGFATDGFFVSTDYYQGKAYSTAFVPFSTLPDFRLADYNSYRLSIRNGDVYVSVNGSAVANLYDLFGASDPTPNRIAFGDFSSDHGSEVEIDYVRYANQAPACDNDHDDDGDGTIDTADPGCSAVADRSERSAALPCDDGIDNDGDGLIDFGDDPACNAADATREHSQCQDGLGNDGDGLIDFDGGASRNDGVPLTDPDPQCVGRPERNSEQPSCGLGAELVPLLGALELAARRRRAIIRARGGS